MTHPTAEPPESKALRVPDHDLGDLASALAKTMAEVRRHGILLDRLRAEPDPKPGEGQNSGGEGPASVFILAMGDQAATHLRAAYRQAVAAPLHALRQQGRALSEEKRRTYEVAIRSAIPDTALPPGRQADLDALTATLAQAEQAGHDPDALLREAVRMRELATAENIEGVLVWRLRRLPDLPVHPETGHRTAAPRPRTGLAQPPTAPRPPLTEPNRNSPRRR